MAFVSGAMRQSKESQDGAARPLVLLVDADPASREIFRDALLHAGYGVMSAPTGEEGLRLAHFGQPDVILGDFPMDVVGHSPFLKDIRQDRALDGTRILVVTARAMEEQIAAAWEVGDEVLLKPLEPKQVVAAVRKLAGPPKS